MAEKMFGRSGLGTIYVVAADNGLIKIGRAVDPVKRVRDLQSFCPARLTVLAVVRSQRSDFDERSLHIRFDRHRRHGEWFTDIPAIRDWARLEAKSQPRLVEMAQAAADAIWNRGGARINYGDREAVRARRAAMTKMTFRPRELQKAARHP